MVDAWAAGTAARTVPPPRVAAAAAGGDDRRDPGGPRGARSRCACSAAPRSRSTAMAVDLSTVRPRARSTLRLLALRAGNAVHRDVLVASLWPDVDEEAALRSLQVAISSLRSVLGGRARSRSTLLARNGESYCLQLPPGSRSDVLDFDARLADARTRRHDGDAAAERAALAAALGHYGGDLLPEEGAAEWVVAERDRLRIAAAGALVRAGQAARRRRRLLRGRRRGPRGPAPRRLLRRRLAPPGRPAHPRGQPGGRPGGGPGARPGAGRAGRGARGPGRPELIAPPADERADSRQQTSAARRRLAGRALVRASARQLDADREVGRDDEVQQAGEQVGVHRGVGGLGLVGTGRGVASSGRSSTPVVRTRTTNPGRSEPGSGVPGLGDQPLPPDSSSSTGRLQASSTSSRTASGVPRHACRAAARATSRRRRATGSFRAASRPVQLASQSTMSGGAVRGSR